MTMQHDTHPHDERLAALAGGDLKATDDRAAAEHVAGCDRCREVVDEIGALRTALAHLPDIAPPRALQLIPPVPAPAASGGFGWLRRLAAPAMAAGAALALVGAVGVTGEVASSMMAGAGAAPMSANDEADGDVSGEGYAPAASAGDRNLETDEETSERTNASAPDVLVERLEQQIDRPSPWLVLGLFGVALLVAGLVLRFAIRPRAG